ncbi:uncharacterized protein LOC118242014 [Electrophorus electricus]|uniref:uncharacterized protein LOC118242014 n=1 Tax=Electrophorus electricus TaxID=8005 RepID=UPI0015D02348|nr:uncharacterized protein LOC118242014 [Electrophorus electricus]XP_035386022.1 uncharacterized protein LOC118242014 [Electrophorus electricus]
MIISGFAVQGDLKIQIIIMEFRHFETAFLLLSALICVRGALATGNNSLDLQNVGASGDDDVDAIVKALLTLQERLAATKLELQTKLEDSERKQKELQTRIDATDAHVLELSKTSQALAKPQVAFTASIQSSGAHGDTLVYGKAITNFGHAYNPQTGLNKSTVCYSCGLNKTKERFSVITMMLIKWIITFIPMKEINHVYY